ncbi:MAG: major facilitator superfamily 1 [Phycisphaerales bacterium]|nr:major facilitator superfamily 1 [Phycisphaerales bacterium]
MNPTRHLSDDIASRRHRSAAILPPAFMRDSRLQYLLTFAMLGTVLPYVSVFFRSAGLAETQIGLAYAIWSLAAVLSPAVATMAADGKVDPRRLLALSSVITAACLLCLGLVRGVGPILCVWTGYCLASMPLFALQDGIHFSQQRRRRDLGQPAIAYHLVRVWGTIGYLIPSVSLFAFLRAGMNLRIVLMTGAGFALLAAAQSTRLLDPRSHDPREAEQEAGADRQIPTLQALTTILGPRLLAFCAAVVLMDVAAQIHSAFYPLYLTARVGLSQEWLGAASGLSVAVEAAIIFSCGWLIRGLGIKRLMLLATLATAVRFGLIGLWTTVWVAMGTQVLHGLLVMATNVLPQTVFDEQAGDGFRHSMQGVFVMLASGGQAVGNLVAGRLAAHGLHHVFLCAVALCAAASCLILFGFREPARREHEPLQTSELVPGIP